MVDVVHHPAMHRNAAQQRNFPPRIITKRLLLSSCSSFFVVALTLHRSASSQHAFLWSIHRRRRLEQTELACASTHTPLTCIRLMLQYLTIHVLSLSLRACMRTCIIFTHECAMSSDPVFFPFHVYYICRPYLAELKKIQYEMTIQGQIVTAAEAFGNLTSMLEAVYNDIIVENAGSLQESTEGYDLFNNIHRAIDGPCYAFVVHGKGPAVGGMGFTLNKDESVTSSNIVIKNNLIQNIKCWTNEIPAAVVDGVVQNDARGAILQFVSSSDGSPISINPDGTYLPNVVSNAQIMVAKAIHDKIINGASILQTGVNTISPQLVEWASTNGATFVPTCRCNGDSMHHVSKGNMIIRVEDTEGFEIVDNTIAGVTNLSPTPFDVGNCADFHLGASVENANEQQGGNIRGIAVAAVTGFTNNNEVNYIVYQ